MKRFWYGLVCLLLVAVNSSDAVASLTVTSETHHVWGWVEGVVSIGPSTIGQRLEYEYMDSNPVSGSAYFPDWEGTLYAESGTGLLEVYARSYAFQTQAVSPFASANADAVWTFQPDDWSLLRLEIDFFSPQSIWKGDTFIVDIYDITSSSQLFYYEGNLMGWPYERPYLAPFVEIFSIDPSHEYRTHLALESSANHDGPWSGYIRAMVIPAPGALFLGGFGLGLVAWLHRRRTL